MSKAPDIHVKRWTSPERHPEIMAMIHAAFGGLTPPSGVLKETVADFARRQREGFVLVAMVDERFAGSMFCAVKDGALYLTRMATHPDWQKRGVGRALMAAAEQEARAMHLPKLLIRVRKNLPGNLAYFSKLGFAVTGEGADPGRPPYDVMERAL
ncbi:MAG: GNAT family N-acetyltransferase [Pseudolabrys sp.]|nr:GNAT family N-acetyltransferase [Pseudolabrys sp.]